MNLKIYDISPKISPRTAIFPGDVPFLQKHSLHFKNGDPYSLSSIQTTLHIGAHSDAPSHYHPKGKSIDEISLEPYLGRCQVLRISSSVKERIYPKNIEGKSIQAKRILFATDSFPDTEKWNKDYNSLSPQLIEYLASKNVFTLGIDTPSVDPACSKKLEAHQEAYKKNIALLEGLILTHVPEGEYQLIALPLKIEGGEASPLRAILLPLRTNLRDV